MRTPTAEPSTLPHAAPADSVRAATEALIAGPVAVDPRECIEQLAALERLKSAISATQARVTHELDQHRRARAEARRLLEPTRRRPNPDAGLGKEIGLARRESPHDGRRKLNPARALLRDLPETLAALERGDLNERRAEIIAGETADLSPGQRRAVDAAISDKLDGLGDSDLRDVVRREVLRRDEDGWNARHEKARAGRRVTGRILGDGMGRLTADLPASDLSVIMTSLSDAAEQARARGDERSRGQLVTDTPVGRLSGLRGDAPLPTAVKLVVSAETLLGDGNEPGYLQGAGYVPASVAGTLAAAGAQHASSTIQRLFAMPRTGALIAAESASSFFRSALADLIVVRDRRCRSPYCNAPDPPSRPRALPGPGRGHLPRQRPGAVRGLQLRQGVAGLAPRARGRPTRRHRDPGDHTDRTHPPLASAGHPDRSQ
ncbi:13E12 repeat family protein [Nocardioides sp. B-3]|nr:13E12 repeat family protein [Nocardioides sp. B-3]UUZ61493.1 13E12 repeat family protein [Nocardioides sp. B-3]